MTKRFQVTDLHRPLRDKTIAYPSIRRSAGICLPWPTLPVGTVVEIEYENQVFEAEIREILPDGLPEVKLTKKLLG